MDGGSSSKQGDDSRVDAPVTGPPVDLHHDAGLTAGNSIELRPGTFRLGPRRSEGGGLVIGAPEAVSFDLTIGDGGEVRLTPGQEPIAVEGVVIDQQVHLDDGDVIQLHSDHFTVRTGRAPDSRPMLSSVTPRTVPAPHRPSMSGWLWFFALLALFGLVVGLLRTPFFGLLLIGVGGIIATMVLRARKRDRAQAEHATLLTNARSLFFREIVERRKVAAEILRAGAGTPTAIARLAADPERSTGSRLHVTIASGDRAWSPTVVCHRDPGWDHQAVVDELSFLPAIPFVADLDTGPVVIIGPRSATLSVARHIATAAMVSDPLNRGVTVETTVPADWGWLERSPDAGLRILDGVDGPLEPRTIVLATSRAPFAMIPATACILSIDDNGRATIVHAGTRGEGFVPHGITTQHASIVQSMTRGRQPNAAVSGLEIDLRDRPHAQSLVRSEDAILDSNRLLVTGTNPTRTQDVISTAALRQALRFPDRSIFILDRGNRALIRLAQLDACRRYVTVDQISKVEFMLNELDAIAAEPDDQRVLVLAPDVWETTAFYRNSGRADLADRIEDIIEQMDVVPLAASADEIGQAPDGVFLVWVDTDTDTNDVTATALGPDGDHQTSQVLDLTQLPGSDLTGSVARLSHPFNEESSQ